MNKRPNNLKDKSYLNGEKLFRKYFEMGEAKSVSRLAAWAIADGMAKPIKQTKQNPNGLPNMGVWKSMWRWASLKENRDTAWKIYKESQGKMSWEEWVTDMVETKIPTAWQPPTHAKRDKFLRENGWL